MIHAIFNIYLVILLIGIIIIILRLHDLKQLLLTFMDMTRFLFYMINKMDNDMKEEELSIEDRVNKLHEDIEQIILHMQRKPDNNKKN